MATTPVASVQTQPMHLPETDPEFPNIVKPQPGDRNAFQQPTRVGDHERVVAKDAGLEDIYAQPSELNPAVVANKSDSLERQRQEMNEAKAREHKAFIDANNVRTEDQAEAEERSRPKEPQPLDEGSETTPAGKNVGKQSRTVAKGKASK